MKQLLALTATAAVVLIIFYSVGYLENKKEQKNTYSQKFEYKESEINKLKRELDDQRLKALKLQAKLDTCRYFVDYSKEVKVEPYSLPKKKKVIKKDYKPQYDSTLQLLNQKRLDCADLEIKLTDELNLRKRQIDTCAYFVQEFDKALIKQGNELTKLTNERDSLSQKLLEPVVVSTAFPCIKTRRGVFVTAKHQIIPGDSRPSIQISVVKNSKTDPKAPKKLCKKAQSH